MMHREQLVLVLRQLRQVCYFVDYLVRHLELIDAFHELVLRQRVHVDLEVVLAAHDQMRGSPPKVFHHQVLADGFLSHDCCQVDKAMRDCILQSLELVLL